ncbi:MAG: carbohydrate ABC transporter permease [Clostridiaceae bacterium]|nr:carbohydrate ABC transporter permease [Clostridiaceae bacterium]
MKILKKISFLEIVGWIIALVMLSPLYIMLVNSFKARDEIFSNTLGLPKSFDFSYYSKAIEKMNFLHALGNSLFITITSVLLIIGFSSISAWILVRNKSRASNIIFYLFVITMLVPFQSIMIPLLQYMSKWGIKGTNFSMLDSYYGLIFMYVGFGLSLSLFLYHGFIKGVPIEMEEAATIDGCNMWQVFWRIVFPTLKPITVTVAILNVIWIWNDYLLPSLVLRQPDLRTVPLSTFYFFGQYTIQWNLAMAGLVLTIIPVIVFYLFAQKHIIKGVMAGAVK